MIMFQVRILDFQVVLLLCHAKREVLVNKIVITPASQIIASLNVMA
jgi:hypothetical protein